MNFIVSATTDIGLTKNTNQDSLSVRTFRTKLGNMVLAVLCDGMGGLAKGEVASASVIQAFRRWSENRLPQLCETGITDGVICADWCQIASYNNERIKTYAKSCGTNMGTTITAMLLTEWRYFIMNVGDTRAYAIKDRVSIMTKDQTVVAREIEMGMLTPEQAEKDPRRSVLLQCIGASEKVSPDMFYGDVEVGCVYMLCSDGFRHEITEDEIYRYLHPNVMCEQNQMKQNMDFLIQIDKQRKERDNISVISIRTF